MSPTGPSRLGSSIAVLPAPVQPEPVKGTFLLCSKVTFSYCCDSPWKIALGLTVHETYVPQSYPWGVEAQVDWRDASPMSRVFIRERAMKSHSSSRSTQG